MREVWYHLKNDEIYLRNGKWAEMGDYQYKLPSGSWMTIPNHLGLMRWKIKMKNWNRAVKNGEIVKIGKL